MRDTDNLLLPPAAPLLQLAASFSLPLTHTYRQWLEWEKTFTITLSLSPFVSLLCFVFRKICCHVLRSATHKSHLYLLLCINPSQSFHFISLSLSLSVCVSACDILSQWVWVSRCKSVCVYLALRRTGFYIRFFLSLLLRLMGVCVIFQCDQIGRFIALWETFQSLWQQLFYPNCPHF